MFHLFFLFSGEFGLGAGELRVPSVFPPQRLAGLAASSTFSSSSAVSWFGLDVEELGVLPFHVPQR